MMNRADITIDSSATLLDALKLMDSSHTKQLIILENGLYVNMVTIGDIQRAIIQNRSLETRVTDIEIGGKVVGYTFKGDSIDRLRALMVEIRADFMPVIDADGRVAEIILREDVLRDKPRISKPLNLSVVIMAGGRGSRLKPISNIIPKPLIPVGNATISENIMDRFIEAGCSNFYFSVNYKKELIKHYFENLPESRYKIEFIVEDKPLGTAGSLHLLKNKISETFFVSNCDILIDQDYREIYAYHREQSNEISLVAALKHFKIAYGTVESGFGGILQSMDEKPEYTYKVNAGLYLLEPHLLGGIPEDRMYHITELISDVKNRGGKVGVFPVSQGAWLDIGEWPEYIRTVRSCATDDEDKFLGL